MARLNLREHTVMGLNPSANACPLALHTQRDDKGEQLLYLQFDAMMKEERTPKHLKEQRVEAQKAPPNVSRYYTERFYPIRA